MVQYSNDNGQTWETLAVHYLVTSFELDMPLLPASDGESLIRVITTDGVNTGHDTSDPFSAAFRAPQAIINAPADGATYDRGELIVLSPRNR